MGDGTADTPKTRGVAEDTIVLAAVSGFPVFPSYQIAREKKISIGFFQYI